MRSTQNTICEAHSRLVLDVSFCHVESTLDTTHWLNVILRLSIISATMDQLCKDMTVKIIPLYAILKACIFFSHKAQCSKSAAAYAVLNSKVGLSRGSLVPCTCRIRLTPTYHTFSCFTFSRRGQPMYMCGR